ncbi:hypothetical protein [Chloroflexus sp.]|uniref:hypothetical protein n=1 Tax=Chloroflexus sp. TaxID=1904827 RepID=UPI002ACE08F9|nr:hypothetical protein [Chloroflexus sp.]
MMDVVHQQQSVSQRIIAGVIGGLVGGVVFGMMMAMMGMLPMIASMVGSSSAVVGFLIHMVISAIIGTGFGLFLGGQSTDLRQGLLWGLGYGFLWWILGPLVLMPLMMGMGVQFGAAFTPPMLMSLVGHLVYGAITGIGCAWYLHGRSR